MHINGRTQLAGPGSLLFCASNDLHAIRNAGTAPATYLVFNFETVATRSAPAQGAAAANVPGTLASTVFNWEQRAVKSTKVGARRDVVNSPTVTCHNFECHVTTLNPDAPPASRRHPDEQIVVVKAGVMEVTINEVTNRGGPGSVFFYGSNDEHGMKNVVGATASYHVIRIVTAATPKAAAQ